jgi:hypothetical protein
MVGAYNEQEHSRRELRCLLIRLGLKSCAYTPMEEMVNAMEEAIYKASQDFGKPNELRGS